MVVIVGGQVQSIPVSINEPRVTLPADLQRSGASAAERGHYEVRFDSDPRLLQSAVGFVRQEGDRITEISAGGAVPLMDRQRGQVSIPLATFSVRTPRREVTLLDHVVKNSPLTVSRANIRGAHVRMGPWQAHAGYSFFANFEHLFLPIRGETVAGVGYRAGLGSRRSLTPNVYYFMDRQQRASTGMIGTLLYEGYEGGGVNVVAELGLSRRIAGAFEIQVRRSNARAWGKVRFVPNGTPSLSTIESAERQIDAGWTAHASRVDVAANASSQRHRLGVFEHESNLGSVDVRYRASNLWTLHGGSGYSMFDSSVRGQSRVDTLTLPAGVGFLRNALGLGLDYQFSSERNRELTGHLVRGNVSLAAAGYHFSA